MSKQKKPIYLFYDRAGKPLADVLAWARLFHDADYQKVAYEEVGTYEVSTMWLGVDHAMRQDPHYRNPHPVIFETLVVGGGQAIEIQRYRTEAEAALGHVEVVKRYQELADGA